MDWPRVAATGAPVRILIIDDNASDRLLLEAMLRNLGYPVLVAESGARALELFRSQSPDLVFVDAVMPEMDGFEVARRIKAEAGETFVPVIFLSALQQDEVLARGLEQGGDDFLTKPFSPLVLEARIRAFSRMRSMHHTLAQQRDRIAAFNRELLHEQEIAKRVFDRIAHAGCLDLPNIKHSLSPRAVFNGDVLLAGTSPSGHLLALLGDFTGHGLAAAVGAMPLAQTFYGMVGKGFGAREIVQEINSKLHDVLPVDVFCCTAVVDMDFEQRCATIFNAGLPDLFVYRADSAALQSLPSRHLALGIQPVVNFVAGAVEIELAPGDRLYLWSDGILEIEDESGQPFGETRLREVFERALDPDNLFMDINIAVNSFLGVDTVADDLTVAEIRFVDSSDFSGMAAARTGSGDSAASDWHFELSLRAPSLRSFNPLPLLLHNLMEIPGLRARNGELYTVLAELYANALEHGVLGLKSSLKSSPESFLQYYRLREAELGALQEGEVRFAFDYCGNESGGLLLIEVEDSGKGFDAARVLGREQDSLAYAGRGIAMVRQLCRSLEYNERGNIARARFGWGDRADEPGLFKEG